MLKTELMTYSVGSTGYSKLREPNCLRAYYIMKLIAKMICESIVKASGEARLLANPLTADLGSYFHSSRVYRELWKGRIEHHAVWKFRGSENPKSYYDERDAPEYQDADVALTEKTSHCGREETDSALWDGTSP